MVDEEGYDNDEDEGGDDDDDKDIDVTLGVEILFGVVGLLPNDRRDRRCGRAAPLPPVGVLKV